MDVTIYSIIIFSLYILCHSLISQESVQTTIGTFLKLSNLGASDFKLEGEELKNAVKEISLYIGFSLIVSVLYYFITFSATPFTEHREKILNRLCWCKRPITSAVFLIQLVFLGTIELLIHVIKFLIPKEWLHINVETELSRFLFENIKAPVMVYLSNGKVYIGTLLSADINPDGKTRYIKIWPAVSGYKKDETHQLILTTVYQDKSEIESIQILLAIKDIVLLSKFNENVTQQFIEEKSIVFDLGFKDKSNESDPDDKSNKDTTTDKKNPKD